MHILICIYSSPPQNSVSSSSLIPTRHWALIESIFKLAQQQQGIHFQTINLQPTYYLSDQILCMDRILGDCFLWSWLIDFVLWLIDFVLWKHLCPQGLFFQKRRALDTTILSKELVLEILSRLPTTSVIRFRSVCKEWCLLTSTQSFIEMHQNNQPTPLESALVIQYFDHKRTVARFQFKTFFINEKATNRNKKFQMVREYIDLTQAKDPEQYYHIDLLSSYKGFLLFTAKSTWPDEQESALILYNPVTKEQMTVTAPPSRYVYCGFFFHLPTKEYRILYQVFDDDNKDVTPRFELLGLQTRSLRRIYVNKSFSAKYHPDPSTPAVISNGALHWMVSEAHHKKVFEGAVPSCSETILSFGIESEEFHLMPHPRFHRGRHDCVSLRRTPGHNMNLLEMEGGILCLCDAYSCSQLDIFVIENYKKWTWVQRLVVPLHAYPEPEYRSSLYYQHGKALQIHQGELVVYFHRYSSPEEYLLYPLNQEEEEEEHDDALYKFMKWISFGSKNLKEELEFFYDNSLSLKKKMKKNVEMSRVKVVIDRLIFKKNEYLDDDQIVRRIVLEHPGKRPQLNYYFKDHSTSLGNAVVLTPSIASLKHHHQSSSTIVNGNGGNYILSLQYENHNTTVTEYNVQTRKWKRVLVVEPSMDRIISGKSKSRPRQKSSMDQIISGKSKSHLRQRI